MLLPTASKTLDSCRALPSASAVSTSVLKGTPLAKNFTKEGKQKARLRSSGPSGSGSEHSDRTLSYLGIPSPRLACLSLRPVVAPQLLAEPGRSRRPWEGLSRTERHPDPGPTLESGCPNGRSAGDNLEETL